ncbi:MAG: PAS domain-containing protein [Betaproteobacteria bacterium]|nr:MAG: PAS domain-containing protein [Betaproteobacteria bacterium]
MDAPVRYPELFSPPEERTPESFWTSLRYFNLYRVAVATLFLTVSLVYGDALNFGSQSVPLFRTVGIAYLVAAIAFQGLLRNLHEYFNLQLSLHAALDIVAITLLMYASSGIRSGLGVMLVIALTGAAIVAPRRLALLYASLAAIALLLEQAYWVLVHDASEANFLQPGLLAMGCFATVGVTSWLSQRVAANEALARQRGRSLATQMRINQLVIRDMHDGVVVLNREGRVVQYNPQAQHLLGADPLLGAPIGELLPGFGKRLDFDIGGRSIGVRTLETGGDEELRVLFVEDMTRTREQAQQLKLAALGRLTANIAHEIRNPLAAISHAAELLGEEKRSEHRRRLTRIIGDNTRRLERLVSDVLQLNRRDRTAAEPIELRPWLAAFIDEFVANERVPAERFTIEGARDLSVEFDREHLHQVMWNLLRNAVRYARHEPRSVRLAIGGLGERVELSVIDNGPGVPASNQGQLFEPFFTTEAKGTGLGLYLARELCAANRAVLEYVHGSSGAHFRIRARQASASARAA